MRKSLNIIVSVFVLAWVICFGLFFSVLHIFFEFQLITSKVLMLYSVVTAVILGLVCTLIAMILLRTEKKTKFGNWLSNNGAKLLFAYMMFILFLISIRAELVMGLDEMKSIISLGWTIMGISIAIFLIWNVVVMEYLKNRMPTKPTSSLPTKMRKYIQEKEDFYCSANFLLNNVNLLLVNLLALVFTTVFVFVSSGDATILSQSMVILVLYLCANTIVGLFLDILKPFNEKKKAMLQETRVTSADVDLQNRIDEETKVTLSAIEAVENMKNISKDVKTIVIAGILENYTNKFGKAAEEMIEEKG